MARSALDKLQRSRREDLDGGTVREAYKRWAPVYDVVFGGVFQGGRERAAEIINAQGGRVLEMGVGTGIALPDYGRNVRVVGVDYSRDMLRKARRRVEVEGLANVEGLAVMDGAKLGFADASFDAAVAMFLITVVPDPEGVLAEMARVVKPGGTIVLVNHFGAEKGPVAAVERVLAQRSRSLGWRPDFPMSRILTHPDLELVAKEKVGPLDFFYVLSFRRRG